MGTLTFQAALGGSVNLLGPNTASNINFTLPSADGTSGQPLQTNGSGTLSFANLAIANGGTGATSFTANQIHYGSFSQSAGLTFDGTNFATTGTATAAKLIPTGTSVTGNGMYLPATNALGFSTAGVEAMRIDSSGRLLVGSTSSSIGGVNVALALDATTANTGYGLGINGNASNTQVARFAYAGTAVGSIVVSGSTTTYNVASDQRLKENIVDAPDFGSVIDAMQVRSFDWITDQTHQRAGFVAQEIINVASEAVYQPIDPKEMMAVDYSKLVPMLVKEIQSLRKRLTALEST